MHSIIGNLSARDKTTKPAPLLRFDHYLDTVSWTYQTRRLLPSEWKRLVDMYEGTPHHQRDDRLGMMKVSFQCPHKELIWELEDLSVKYDGNPSRFDIGNDVRPGSTNLDYIEQTKLLWEMILLRDRNKGKFGIEPNDDGTIGTFWNPFSEGEKPPARDIVVYPDPISKLPHRQAVGHFDYRSRAHARLRAMRKQGIGNGLKSLTELDPSRLLRDNIRIVECDMQKEQRRYFQWLAQNQTVENARRMIDDKKRFGQIEYVQRLRDQYPNCKVVDDWGRVSFSHSLSWGATRRELQNEPSTRHMIKVNDDNDL